jgi:hypothetical protein
MPRTIDKELPFSTAAMDALRARRRELTSQLEDAKTAALVDDSVLEKKEAFESALVLYEIARADEDAACARADRAGYPHRDNCSENYTVISALYLKDARTESGARFVAVESARHELVRAVDAVIADIVAELEKNQREIQDLAQTHRTEI